MSDTPMPEPGTKAPAFSLPDQTGKKVALKDFAGKWLVFYSYPKDDTPGCTVEAIEFTGLIDTFHKQDAEVVGISPDSESSHVKFCDKHSLKLTLLSDPDHKVLEKYGFWGTKMLYGKESVGVIRRTLIIDPSGKVAHVWRSVKTAGHAEKVLERLTELQAAAG
ncbi:MAG: thioredoxin-dependent thiol peroxidase [Planctomycetota bacterium]